MNNCCDDNNSNQILTYRIVQTISDRNTIPCDERLNGMKVTVIGSDNSYKQYMMQGGDPCVNTNWVELLSYEAIIKKIGHKTIELEELQEITNLYLNERYPTSEEGFTVSFIDRNTTFMKVSGDRWVITNNKIQ